MEYFNDSFQVDGGRDVKLINLLADKLNFRYEICFSFYFVRYPIETER